MSDVESFVRFCESEFGQTVMDREAAYVERYISDDDRSLDIGCGIGSLEERFPDHNMIGMDCSEAMARTARKRVHAPSLIGAATALPFADGFVSAIFFVSTLEFIPDVDAALTEATRVLDSDGTLIALVLNTRSEYVQSNLQRDGSYFQRMVHRDSETLTDRILEHIEGTRELFLGIEDQTVFESSEPTTAALSAVVGTPTGQSQ